MKPFVSVRGAIRGKASFRPTHNLRVSALKSRTASVVPAVVLSSLRRQLKLQREWALLFRCKWLPRQYRAFALQRAIIARDTANHFRQRLALALREFNKPKALTKKHKKHGKD